MRKVVSLAILVLLSALAVWYVARNRADFAFIADLDASLLAMLAAVSLAYLLTQCVLLRDSVRPFGVTLRPMEWVGLMMMTFFANYFIPFSGLGTRALYLSRRHGLSLTHFSVAMGGVLLVELLVYSLAGILALLATGATGWDVRLTMLGLGGLAVALGLGSLIPPKAIPFSGALAESLRQAIVGWRQMASHPGTMVSLVVWTVVQFACFAVMFHFALMAVGAQAGWLGAMVVAALTDFAFLIRLAPASAGSFEVAILFGSSLFDVSTAQALVVAALVRLMLVAWFILLAPWFFYRLHGRNEPS